MSRFQERRAWAIEHRWPEHPNGGLLGVGYFGWPELTQEHLAGCTIALFKTRELARIALARHRASIGKQARVLRVTVRVSYV